MGQLVGFRTPAESLLKWFYPIPISAGVICKHQVFSMPKSLKKMSMGDVAKHTSEEDVWITLHGKVYNVSKYMDDHPGECGLARVR